MITPSGAYGVDQQGLFGTTPAGPSFHDYVYSQSNAGFGVNAQYMTPNYTAAYRPAYGGPTGEPNPYQTPTSIGTSAWYAAQSAPFPGAGFGSQTPYYQNALGVQDYHAHNLVAIGPDASANLLQQYVAPIGAAYAASKISNVSPFMASGIKRSVQGMFGMGARESIGYRAGSMVGRVIGGGIGGTAGAISKGLIGRGSVMGAAGALGAVGGVVGGIAGTIAAPIIIGQGIYNALDHAAFDPYIQTRRGAEALKTNFYNQAMGGQVGNVNGGLGMSSTSAYQISAAVNQQAFTDFAFKDGDYTSMMDYSAQAGLFDSMRGSDFNATNMSKKMKDIAGSVKQIMHVFGEKDMQEAIGILSRFSKMGFGPGTSELASSLSSIRATAAYSGKSAGEIFHSAYMPAAYAFQGQGLSALTGGRAAVDAYRGFEAALKNGLVDKSVLATLGGAEGATQLSTNALLRMAGSQYNQMAAYNQAFLGAPVDGIAGNIQAFARGMGSDPLRASGNLALYGNQMLTKQLNANKFAPYTQAADLLRMIKPGDKNAADFAAILQQSNGLSAEEARAAVLEIQSAMRVDQSQLTGQLQADAVTQQLESDGMSFVSPALLTATRKAIVGAKTAISTPGNYIGQGIGIASDAVSKALFSQQFPGIRTAESNEKSKNLALTFQGAGTITTYRPNDVRSSSDYEVVDYVNKYAQSLDPRMRELASKVITNKGVVDTKAFAALQKATGDNSVSAADVVASSRGSNRFSSMTKDYGKGDAAPLDAAMKKIMKENNLSNHQLALDFMKAQEEGDIAVEEFLQNNAEAIKAAALEDVNKSAIKGSGAFDTALGFADPKFVIDADPFDGKDSSSELRTGFIKSVKSTDTKRLKSLMSGVEELSWQRAMRTQEGQGLNAYLQGDKDAAKQILAAEGLKVSNTRDVETNKRIGKASMEAGATTAASMSLMKAMRGIDYNTGLNLDQAMKTSNPFEKAGAMLLKGANIIAATAEEEARRKGKSYMEPKSPSPTTGLLNSMNSWVEKSGMSVFGGE